MNVRGHGGSAAIEDHPSPLQVDASRAQAPGWSEFFEHPAFDYFDFCGTEASLAYDQSEQDALAHSEHAPDQTRVPASVVFEEMTQPEPGSAPSDIISF